MLSVIFVTPRVVRLDIKMSHDHSSTPSTMDDMNEAYELTIVEPKDLKENIKMHKKRIRRLNIPFSQGFTTISDFIEYRNAKKLVSDHNKVQKMRLMDELISSNKKRKPTEDESSSNDEESSSNKKRKPTEDESSSSDDESS